MEETYKGFERRLNPPISLMDYIAIHAPAEEISIMGFHYYSGTYLEPLSAARYRYADQMLKAREPQKDEK